ncbi:hypothetical protein [Lysobacter capsici]|uniref:hypothetical protein n=1 Tax=Lysobacter capsici TaxID=435897 RepID=UPI001C0076C6|nr:hypothetical protein [Lysobacter capsici]QWF16303.1 hypothetical protein KME82_21510 [Lysobacter capsici]
MATKLYITSIRLTFGWLAFATVIAGCTSAPSIGTTPSASSLSIEQLVRLPAENGHAGLDQVVRALQARYGERSNVELSPLTNTATPITLADGTVITQAVTNINGSDDVARDVFLGIAERPCLDAHRIAAMIGAKKGYEVDGDDMTTGHSSYFFQSAQIDIEMEAQRQGPACVRSIAIYKRLSQ